MATEANFRALKEIEVNNLIVPLVGDFAGPKAIRSVGAYLKEHKATVTAFYLSNVEQYLFNQGDDWRKFYRTSARCRSTRRARSFARCSTAWDTYARSRFMRGQQMLASMLAQIKAFNEGQARVVLRRRFRRRASSPRKSSTPTDVHPSIAAPDYDIAPWRARIPLLASLIPMNNCSQAPQTDAHARGRRAVSRVVECERDGLGRVDGRSRSSRRRSSRDSSTRRRRDRGVQLRVGGDERRRERDRLSRRRGERSSSPKPSSRRSATCGSRRSGAARACRGFRCATASIALDDYDALVDDRTAIVSACHGYYLNGFMQDVARASPTRAHARGALLYVDAYQTLGTMPVDVRALGRRLSRRRAI